MLDRENLQAIECSTHLITTDDKCHGVKYKVIESTEKSTDTILNLYQCCASFLLTRGTAVC